MIIEVRFLWCCSFCHALGRHFLSDIRGMVLCEQVDSGDSTWLRYRDGGSSRYGDGAVEIRALDFVGKPLRHCLVNNSQVTEDFILDK